MSLAFVGFMQSWLEGTRSLLAFCSLPLGHLPVTSLAICCYMSYMGSSMSGVISTTSQNWDAVAAQPSNLSPLDNLKKPQISPHHELLNCRTHPHSVHPLHPIHPLVSKLFVAFFLSALCPTWTMMMVHGRGEKVALKKSITVKQLLSLLAFVRSLLPDGHDSGLLSVFSG